MDTNTLPEDRRKQLDDIVQKMVVNKEPDSNIRFVVDDFKKKYTPTQTPPTQEPKGFVGNAVETLGNLSEGAVKGGLKTVQGLAKLGNNIADQTAGRVVSATQGKGFVPTGDNVAVDTPAIDEALEPEGTAQNIGFGVEKVAEFAIPGTKAASLSKGAGLGVRALTEGVTGLGVASAQNGDVNQQAVETGIVSSVLPVVGAGLAKGGSYLTNSLPKRLIQSAIGQPTKELLAGKDVAPYMLTKGKFGTAEKLIGDSQKAIEGLSLKIGNNLNSTIEKGVNVEGKNILNTVSEKINQEGGEIKPQEIYDTVISLAPQAKGLVNRFMKEGLNLSEANRLRQLLDKTLGDKAFLANQLPFRKDILRMFDNELRGNVKELAPEGTKELFDELSKEITLRDAMLERTTAQSRNQVLNGFDLLFGTGGFAGAGPLGALMTVGAKKAAQSTAGKTAAAQVLDKAKLLGPILDKLAPDEKALIQELVSGSSGEK